jgi:DNA-binding MarR family transcriptional regulator
VSQADAIREKHDGALTDHSSVRLWLRLLSCTTVIEKRIRRRLADRYDATLPRFDVLAALDRAPEGMTMGALSRKLLVSSGNVTGVVQALLRDDYVAMAPSPTDGRVSIVRLTQAGQEYFTGLSEAHHEWVDAMLAGVSRAEKEALYELLGALKLSLAADTGEENS